MVVIFINIFTLAITLVLLFMLLILPAKTKKRNSYIILLLVALATHLLAEHFFLIGLFGPIAFSIITVSMVTMFGPALFFYTRKFYGRSTRHFLYHIIPYQIVLCFIWFLQLTNTWLFPQWVLSGFYGSIILIYFIATVYILSQNTIKKHDAWMKTIGIGFGILVLLHLIEIILINTYEYSKKLTIVYSTSVQNIFSFLFLLIVIKQIITNPKLFSNANIRIPYKHDNSIVDVSQLDKVLEYVELNKAYKNPALNRKIVSNVSGLSVNQISEIINSTYKKNFNEWINDYRIKEAQLLLKESQLNIKEVYFEVGFNSKSAFNNAFKKRVYKTPSNYRSDI